jgi:hypothetical protein
MWTRQERRQIKKVGQQTLTEARRAIDRTVEPELGNNRHLKPIETCEVNRNSHDRE